MLASGTSSAIVTIGGSSQTDSLSFLLEQRDGSGNPTHSSSGLGSSARRRNITLAPEAADESDGVAYSDDDDEDGLDERAGSDSDGSDADFDALVKKSIEVLDEQLERDVRSLRR